MFSLLTLFVTSFILSFVLTPLVRNLALRYGWVDQPGGRKIHASPIPRAGGIAIAIAYMAAFGVLFLLTLLSAAMSTMSSQFHTMGTALGRDVFEQYRHHEHGTKSILVTRLAIIVGIVVALVLGKYVRGNIIALATAIFFGLCASSFLPMFVLGLFWKRMNKAAATASLLVGFLTSAFWLLFVNGKTAAGLGLCKAWLGRDNLIVDAQGLTLPNWSLTWTVVDPIVVALPLSLLTAVVVALVTRPMPSAHVAYVFGGPKPNA